jgi:hypothetical protein
MLFTFLLLSFGAKLITAPNGPPKWTLDSSFYVEQVAHLKRKSPRSAEEVS